MFYKGTVYDISYMMCAKRCLVIHRTLGSSFLSFSSSKAKKHFTRKYHKLYLLCIIPLRFAKKEEDKYAAM